MKRCPTMLISVGICLALGTGCGKGSDRYSAVSEHSGKCLSLEVPAGFYDGDPVQQWACNQIHMGFQKEWLFVPQQVTSQYQVKSIFSGKCLEVKLSAASGKNDGDVIQQSKCTGADNQKWNVVTTSAGSTTFTSVHSGKCLQIKLGSSGGMQDGDAIEQWSCTAGAKHQTWKLQAANPPPPNPPLDTGTGELCNVCNPANPQCKPGAQCIITTMGQSICGQSCSPSAGCPSGYSCTKIMKTGQTYFQCVPTDNTCPL